MMMMIMMMKLMMMMDVRPLPLPSRALFLSYVPTIPSIPKARRYLPWKPTTVCFCVCFLLWDCGRILSFACSSFFCPLQVAKAKAQAAAAAAAGIPAEILGDEMDQ